MKYSPATADPDNPVYHEVWEINKSKQELKALKLTKGKVFEAILFRHTYEAELVSGEKVTITRHNLVKVIYYRRAHSFGVMGTMGLNLLAWLVLLRCE